ncbi:MAG: Fe-S cluster assembly protein SufD [Hyphomicrobiaceae bacterium]|nr:Fe-S cluster assembly protein SufD [Hyphomicrobiaceae bacterium]
MSAMATIERTRAETALAENFAGVADRLPGGRAVAEARRAAIGTFGSLGLPHRRIEEWKYSDLRSVLKDALPPAVGTAGSVSEADIDLALRQLARIDAHRIVFVDGVLRPELSEAAPPRGFEVTPLAQALGKPGVGLMHDDLPGHAAVVALNTAYVTDGAVIKVAQGASLAKPILLVFARSRAEGSLVTTRNVVSIAADAEATLIEAHVALAPGKGQENALTELTVGESARVAHVKLALSGDDASHLGTALVRLGRGAVYKGFQLTAETGFARNTSFLTYTGPDARADISGVFLARRSEHVDTTLVIDHAVPACESRELFKGVLDGRGRGVFQGKVIVRPDAQKSDGKQMAQALMLSEEAEFDSKPELEIFADDVVCGHGSTCAEIDDDLLFYMRSRGIDKQTARTLLIESFIAEATAKIDAEPLREAVHALAVASLGARKE